MNNNPLKLQNRLDDILWSLEMIKEQSHSKDGCTIKDTGGFIANGQVDDLILIVSLLKKEEKLTYRLS